MHEQGDLDGQLERAGYTQTYVAPAVHATINRQRDRAYDDGKLELWIAAQAPELTRRAAKAIGIAAQDVVLYPTAAGGSFDARLERRHAIEVLNRQEIGQPVPLAARAECSHARAHAVIARLDAGFLPASGGRIAAWRAQLAMPSTMREFGQRLFDNKTAEAAIGHVTGEADPLACEGAVPPYAIEHVAIDHLPVALPFPTGRLRGNSAAYTAFFTESFIDELAERAGRDPFLYRMEMLGRMPRMADCLRRATRLANWDGGRRGTGQGLAMVRIGAPDTGGRIACVAQAARGEGGVRVTRLHAAVDIGRVVNHDIARQQIEGGLIFGLSLATGSSLAYENGKPVPQRLAGLSLPTLADCPEIVIEFLASDAPPFDPGELGVGVAPPAIANALYSATGVRFRRLPLLSEGL